MSLLESITLLYGEAIGNNYDEEGCAAFHNMIRCLEIAEVAPTDMIIKMLCRLMTNYRDDMQFGFLLETWQVVSLLRLRWPETGGLNVIENYCQEKFDKSPSLKIIRDLVRSGQLNSFDHEQETPPLLSDTPHKYCPGQRTLLVAPDKYRTWALDLRTRTMTVVEKKGRFHSLKCYRLQVGQSEDYIEVPAASSDDLDFIFDYLK
ncbi:hypothetical protein F4678DRAFT_485185 [Xylaria arbuscula]|nr:hypothetical protein F4678DRAFT_485185 [Xylaria arbuscula]